MLATIEADGPSRVVTAQGVALVRRAIIGRDSLLKRASVLGTLVLTTVETQAVGSVVAPHSGASLLRFSSRPSGSGSPPSCALFYYGACRIGCVIVMIMVVNILPSYSAFNSWFGEVDATRATI